MSRAAFSRCAGFGAADRVAVAEDVIHAGTGWLCSGVFGDNLFSDSFEARMKITDDYKAKYRLWAANPTVVPAPDPAHLSNFKSRRFSSHTELNAWKLSVLREVAQASPVK